MVLAIRKAVGTSVVLRADANRKWTLEVCYKALPKVTPAQHLCVDASCFKRILSLHPNGGWLSIVHCLIGMDLYKNPKAFRNAAGSHCFRPGGLPGGSAVPGGADGVAGRHWRLLCRYRCTSRPRRDCRRRSAVGPSTFCTLQMVTSHVLLPCADLLLSRGNVWPHGCAKCHQVSFVTQAINYILWLRRLGRSWTAERCASAGAGGRRGGAGAEARCAGRL